MRTSVLVTCNNRCDEAIASPNALLRSAESSRDQRVCVFPTDGGSTSGTSEAVSCLLPPVEIVHGDGRLRWDIRTVGAGEAADESSEHFDAYLHLNDDTIVDGNAMTTQVDLDRSVAGACSIVGAVRDSGSGEASHGGLRRTSKRPPGKVARVQEADVVQDVDTFNANCVFVPRRIRELLGTLVVVFAHGMGDVDCGPRTQGARARVLVAPGTVGTCQRVRHRGSGHDRSIPVRQRLPILGTPKGLPWREWEPLLRDSLGVRVVSFVRTYVEMESVPFFFRQVGARRGWRNSSTDLAVRAAQTAYAALRRSHYPSPLLWPGPLGSNLADSGVFMEPAFLGALPV